MIPLTINGAAHWGAQQKTRVGLWISACTLLVVGLTPTGRLSAQPAPTPEPVASTGRFELRSAPRSALFHFLLDWASADAGEWPRYAPPLVERNGWEEALAADERRVWEAALKTIAPARRRSLLFDEGLIALRAWSAGAIPHERIPASDRVLADAIESALPVYLKHWWPAHDARNRAWIDAVAPGLRRIEEEVISRLVAAYGGRWPTERVPVDVVPYANPVGAYSTAGRLTLSSVDRENAMPQALELVFHEASHIESLESPLTTALEAAFRARGGTPPERFWHDMIFYTSGEITRIALERAGQPGYRHYGEVAGVYARGERWQVELPALRRHWRPFLDSGSADPAARREALEKLAADLLGTE